MYEPYDSTRALFLEPLPAFLGALALFLDGVLAIFYFFVCVLLWDEMMKGRK